MKKAGIETFVEYQHEVIRTMNHSSGLANYALGLAGEAGETADYLKKVLFHGHELDNEKLMKELGDVLWYITAVAEFNGYDLEQIAQMNIIKLRQRYPDGFDQTKSIKRKE
jgi:NTP pyrophosphatase (non-canonical NTP hydrolase)